MSNKNACETDPENVSAFLDGELPEQETERLREHIDSCLHCQELLEDLRGTRELFESVPRKQAPEGFTEGVRNQIQGDESVSTLRNQRGTDQEEKTTRKTGDFSGKHQLERFATLAAGVLIAIFLGTLIYRPFPGRKSQENADADLEMAEVSRYLEKIQDRQEELVLQQTEEELQLPERVRELEMKIMREGEGTESEEQKKKNGGRQGSRAESDTAEEERARKPRTGALARGRLESVEQAFWSSELSPRSFIRSHVSLPVSEQIQTNPLFLVRLIGIVNPDAPILLARRNNRLVFDGLDSNGWDQYLSFQEELIASGQPVLLGLQLDREQFQVFLAGLLANGRDIEPIHPMASYTVLRESLSLPSTENVREQLEGESQPGRDARSTRTPSNPANFRVVKWARRKARALRESYLMVREMARRRRDRSSENENELSDDPLYNGFGPDDLRGIVQDGRSSPDREKTTGTEKWPNTYYHQLRLWGRTVGDFGMSSALSGGGVGDARGESTESNVDERKWSVEKEKENRMERAIHIIIYVTEE